MPKILSKKAKLAIAAGAMLILFDQKPRKRVWMKENAKKQGQKTDAPLVKSVQSDEPVDVLSYLRMDYATFQELLTVIRPYIERQNTLLRDAISVEGRLLATLRFLTTGKSYVELKDSLGISSQALGEIIPETCSAINYVLRKEFLQLPSNEEDWVKTATDFERIWLFDNCLGIVDGKHIAIKQPPNSGAHFKNHKKFCSVVLFTIVNANYEFIYVNSGTNGAISDGSVIQHTDFYNLLTTNSLGLPEPVKMPGIEKKLPYVFIADEAFGLMTNLMTPYEQPKNDEEELYNYRLLRTRSVADNTLRIMANKFRVLLEPIGTKVSTVDEIISACCILHNFLRRKCCNYILASDIDNEETTTGEIGKNLAKRELTSLQVTTMDTTADAEDVRDGYKKYFSNAGALNLQ